MNVIASLAIFPVGESESLSPLVSKVIQVFQNSDLDTQTTAMTTLIEGDYDKVMATIKEATMILAEEGHRTYVTLNMDIRPGYENRMQEKLKSIDQQLNKKNIK